MDEDQKYLEEEEVSAPETKGKIWTYDTTAMLISLYDKYKYDFFDPTIRKVFTWEKISKEMKAKGYNYSSDCCDSKWRNMKKSYRASLFNLKDASVRWRYFDALHEIFSNPPHALDVTEDGQPILVNSAKKPKQTITETEEPETIEVADVSQFLLFEAQEQNDSADSDFEQNYNKKASSSSGASRVRKKIPRQIKSKQRKEVSVENGKLVFNILQMDNSDTSSEDEANDESAPDWFKRFVKRHRKDEKRKMKMLQAMHNDFVEMEREKLIVLKSLIEKLPTT